MKSKKGSKGTAKNKGETWKEITQDDTYHGYFKSLMKGGNIYFFKAWKIVYWMDHYKGQFLNIETADLPTWDKKTSRYLRLPETTMRIYESRTELPNKILAENKRLKEAINLLIKLRKPVDKSPAPRKMKV